MIEHRAVGIRPEEAARLRHREEAGILRRLFGKVRKDGRPRVVPDLVDEYRVSVRRCLIPADFNEELPLYLLDVGRAILILFGQWLHDPHTVPLAPKVLEQWACDRNFFAEFSLRCRMGAGIVLSLQTQADSFIGAARLTGPLRFKKLGECALVPLGAGPVEDALRSADLIY